MDTLPPTQSKAMSTPPISSVLEEPESPKSTSSQETPWSTQSINNTLPLGNQLSPGWVHAITIIMGNHCKKKLEKCSKNGYITT